MSTNRQADELSETIIRLLNESKPQTVKQLVNLVRATFPLPENEVLDKILKMQREGLVKFGDSRSPTPTFSDFVRSKQAVWYWLTIASSIFTVFLVFLIGEDSYPWNYFRNIFGLIFVLWLPGYAFTKTLFPKGVTIGNTPKDLETPERIALSVVMSLALVSILGLLLNFSPWGIRLVPMVLSLLPLNLILATAGVIREYYAKTTTLKDYAQTSQ